MNGTWWTGALTLALSSCIEARPIESLPGGGQRQGDSGHASNLAAAGGAATAVGAAGDAGAASTITADGAGNGGLKQASTVAILDGVGDDAGGVAPSLGKELSCQGLESGALAVSAIDANCYNQMPDSCPQGTHIDFTTAAPCALCLTDTDENRTCAWAEECFEPFIQYVAHAAGNKACDELSSCSSMTVSAGCGAAVSIALNAAIDEEIPRLAELYAAQNCSLCGVAFASFDVGWAAVCVDGGCQLEK